VTKHACLPQGTSLITASSNGSKIAGTLAQRAAKQPPKAMRSASLSYVKQAIREKWKPMATLDKHVKGARKSVSSRYLQLKSGHAITGVHLLRIGKVKDQEIVTSFLFHVEQWRSTAMCFTVGDQVHSPAPIGVHLKCSFLVLHQGSNAGMLYVINARSSAGTADAVWTACVALLIYRDLLLCTVFIAA